MSRCEIQNLFENALKYNNYHFVNLLLENGLDLKCFLKLHRFLNLLSYTDDDKEKSEPFYFYVKESVNISDINKRISFMINKIEKLRTEIFPFVNFHILPENFKFEKFYKFANELIDEPEIFLFYWCILTNRIEIAKIFWRIGNV